MAVGKRGTSIPISPPPKRPRRGRGHQSRSRSSSVEVSQSQSSSSHPDLHVEVLPGLISMGQTHGEEDASESGLEATHRLRAHDPQLRTVLAAMSPGENLLVELEHNPLEHGVEGFHGITNMENLSSILQEGLRNSPASWGRPEGVYLTPLFSTALRSYTDWGAPLRVVLRCMVPDPNWHKDRVQ